MFETDSQKSAAQALMSSNVQFKQLYQRHQYLDKKLMDSDLGVNGFDDMTVQELKREKLAAKQRLMQWVGDS
ncbi:YdcH family protein [Aquilutibacter rugosus]|uniref:YdcH family protein n=1 Tax=Aquilutibacter rugosus TaxID=3115820 RepID=UPI002F420A0E